MPDPTQRGPRLSTRPPDLPGAAPAIVLWLPLATAVAVAVLYNLAPEWTWTYLFDEGWGLVELAHFLVPLAAAAYALRAWRRLPRGGDPWLSALLIALALGSIYIAGEEHSWGQHFFYWETPASWAEINRQDETNLHNTSSWLNHKPRVVLNIAVIFATVIVPLMEATGRGTRLLDRFRFVLPGPDSRALGLLVIFYMIYDTLAKDGVVPKIASREAEMHELFLYAFILVYAYTLFRRIGAWRAAHAAAAPAP